MTWWTAGNEWLCKKANDHFHAWAESPDGAKWRVNRGKSPYKYGYTQPDWMRDAVEALGKNDEHWFKRIKLDNL